MIPNISAARESADDGSPPVLHRWRGRDLAFFAGIFVIMVVISAVVEIVAQSFVEGPTAGVIIVLALTFFVEISLLYSTFFLVRNVYGLSYLKEMRISRNYRIANRSLVVLGAGLALTVIVVSGLVSTLLPGLFPEQETALESLLTNPQSVALFAVFGVAVAPALEELMFRGFLFRVLQDVVGVSVAVWTTAAIFAVAHGGQLWPNWPAILVILAVGYVLSKLREKTNSVIPGFIVHTIYNAVLFLIFAFASVIDQ